MDEIKLGDMVIAHYKTGTYIGELTSISPSHCLVKILAVLKHPMQGDLHHPKEANVPLFHERKALAFREQANIPKNMVKKYTGEIPDYTQSLREAIDKMKSSLENDTSEWSAKSLKNLAVLENEYFK